MSIKSILLIDDDEATNFFHEIIIEEWGKADKVLSLDMAAKALEYLQTKVNGVYPNPDLILLDLNMPGMDGWEFMAAYKELTEDARKSLVVVMLTTSINPDDRNKANAFGEIKSFENKPLTGELLDKFEAILKKKAP